LSEGREKREWKVEEGCSLKIKYRSEVGGGRLKDNMDGHAASVEEQRMRPRYLVYFFDEWNNFKVPELNSLLELFGASSEYLVAEEELGILEKGSSHEGPFLLLDLPNEEMARQLCSRSVLIRSIYQVWSYGNTVSECIQGVRAASIDDRDGLLVPWMSRDKTWCVEVHGYCRALSQEQKGLIRQNFSFLAFQGPVHLSNPLVTISVLLDFSPHVPPPSSNSGGAFGAVVEDEEEMARPRVPCYCGRLLARGGMREELRKYDLKKRLYLGPTSLDHTLAMIMANLANAKRGSFAFDPFVGTASILIALSHFGAKCTGTDIDPRVLRGAMYAGAARHKEEPSASTRRDVLSTFAEYGLEVPELIRMDAHLLERHFQLSTAVSEQGFFDLIVSDPPYGIRAGGRKSGKPQGVSYVVPDERRLDHIPSTQAYPVEEAMLDLLHTAARLLILGGSLCYLIPTTYDFALSDLPTHPCLEIRRLCQQGLSTRHGRHAVLMRKHCAYSEILQDEFARYRVAVMSDQDDGGFGRLISKLESALAVGAHEDPCVVKQTSNAAKRRQDSKKWRNAYRAAGLTNEEGGGQAEVAEEEEEEEEEEK